MQLAIPGNDIYQEITFQLEMIPGSDFIHKQLRRIAKHYGAKPHPQNLTYIQEEICHQTTYLMVGGGGGGGKRGGRMLHALQIIGWLHEFQLEYNGPQHDTTRPVLSSVIL